MIKIILSVILSMIFCTCYSQDKTSLNTEESKNNHIGISLTPKISAPKNREFTSSLKNHSLPSYSGGINYWRGLTSTLFINIELGYLSNRLSFKDIPNTVHLINDQGEIMLNEITYFDIHKRYNYFFLSTSIGSLLYEFTGTTFLWGDIGLQGMYSYSIHEQTKGFIRDGEPADSKLTIRNNEIERAMNLAGFCSIGIAKSFSNELSLLIAPQFIYDINSIKEKVSDSSIGFYNIGLNIKVLYTINK